MRIENADPVLTNIAFVDNVGAAARMDLNSNPAIMNVAFANNAINGLALDGGTLGEDGFWDDSDLVYWMTDDVIVPAGRTLTLGAGQAIKGAAFTTDLLVDGTLVGRGTANAPIVVTSAHDDTAGGDTNNNGANTAPGPNPWGVVLLRGPGNVLEHADVRSGWMASSPCAAANCNCPTPSSATRGASGCGSRTPIPC